MNKQLRIAIALAALRHKPPNQSIQAYILDLQAAFPVSCSCQACHSGNPPPPEPWRERVSVLEKELEDVRAQKDRDEVELLALRKAAQSHQARPAPDDARETDSSTAAAPTNSKKAKGKKAKPASATPAPSIPALAPAPTPRPKAGLGAILQGCLSGQSLLGPGSSSRIASALDAADALVELLAADPLAVSVDLVLSTTLRAVRAAGAVFSMLIARHGSQSCLTSDNGGESGRVAPGTGSGWDPALTLETLTTLLRSLVSAVVSALVAQRNSAERQTKKRRISNKARRTAQTTSAAAATGLDDILGCLYEVMLAPAVRALVPLSEGYLSACLTNTSGNTAANDASTFVPDLRPDVFALLEGMLAIFGDGLSGIEPTSSATAGPPAGTPSSAAAATPVPAPIPDCGSVRTLLALECVRELEKLYPSHDTPTSMPADQNTDARPGARSDSPQQAYPRRYPRTATAFPADITHAPGSIPAPSSSPQAAPRGVQLSPARDAPRAARNLGETRSGPVRGTVLVGDADAAPARGGKAKRGGGKDRARARIAKLARKDAAWWLCAVLDRLLPSLPPPPSPASEPCTEPGGDWVTPGSCSGPPVVTCAEVANGAVYDALADLLRRTRPPRSGPNRVVATASSAAAPSSRSPRGQSPAASNHAGAGAIGVALDTEGADVATCAKSNPSELGNAGPREGPGEGTAKVDQRAGYAGMGVLERGMLLAVLERAWLGV